MRVSKREVAAMSLIAVVFVVVVCVLSFIYATIAVSTPAVALLLFICSLPVWASGLFTIKTIWETR